CPPSTSTPRALRTTNHLHGEIWRLEMRIRDRCLLRAPHHAVDGLPTRRVLGGRVNQLLVTLVGPLVLDLLFKGRSRDVVGIVGVKTLYAPAILRCRRSCGGSGAADGQSLSTSGHQTKIQPPRSRLLRCAREKTCIPPDRKPHE